MPGPPTLAVAVMPAVLAGRGSDGTETPTGAERRATMAGASAGSCPTCLPRGNEPADLGTAGLSGPKGGG